MRLAVFNSVMCDSSLSHACKLLFMYLYQMRDYETNVVGLSRRISYVGVAQYLSYEPVRGSTAKQERYNHHKIKRMFQALVGRNMITKSDESKPGDMIYRVILVDAGLIRTDEERPMSALGAPQYEGVDSTGAGGVVLQGVHTPILAPFLVEERPTSPVSPKLLNNSNELLESFPLGDNQKLKSVDQDGLVGSGSARRYPVCPHRAIVDLFAEVLPMVKQPLLSKWESSRPGYKNLSKRWAEGFVTEHSEGGRMLYVDKTSGLVWWRALFVYIAKLCPFLINSCKGFDLDWLVKPDNFRKILERNYEDKNNYA